MLPPPVPTLFVPDPSIVSTRNRIFTLLLLLMILWSFFVFIVSYYFSIIGIYSSILILQNSSSSEEEQLISEIVIGYVISFQITCLLELIWFISKEPSSECLRNTYLVSFTITILISLCGLIVTENCEIWLFRFMFQFMYMGYVTYISLIYIIAEIRNIIEICSPQTVIKDGGISN
jgi:hypothetical protein